MILVALYNFHSRHLSLILTISIHLNFSAIALQDEIWEMPNGEKYYRRKGEALHPTFEFTEQLVDILKSIGGYAFSYQYLQGQYKPKFQTEGSGCLWLTPQREGEYWGANIKRRHGFYKFSEADLILSKVFGIGEDPNPPKMRGMTYKEWVISAQKTRSAQIKSNAMREMV